MSNKTKRPPLESEGVSRQHYKHLSIDFIICNWEFEIWELGIYLALGFGHWDLTQGLFGCWLHNGISLVEPVVKTEFMYSSQGLHWGSTAIREPVCGNGFATRSFCFEVSF